MPRPPTVHATSADQAGMAGCSATTIPAMPASTITRPMRISRRPSQVSFSLACTQAPAVHDSVAPVTATPAYTGV